VFGIFAGTIAGWLIVTEVMRIPFALELSGAVTASALAVLVTISLGLAGTWRILSQKPAPYLRNL
jgi:putative ABC transport system permease protein